VAEKNHCYPTPCTALWGEGRGKGGCYLYGPEDLLIKTRVKLKLSSKAYTENYIFNENL
jgi:hypothetical protein